MEKPPRPTPSSFGRLRAASTSFFRWWATELAGWVPVRVRLWWRETGNLVLVLAEGNRIRFLRPVQEGLTEIHVVDATAGTPTANTEQLAADLKKVTGGSVELMLCLPADQVLQRSVTLPAAVEENLRQTLGFELDRFTPFRPDQAHFDFRVDERQPEKGTICVTLAVAPRALLDKMLQQVRALGLPIGGAVLAEDVQRRGSQYLNLLPTGVRHTRHTSITLAWRLALSALALILLAVALAIPLWQKRAAAISLIPPLDQAKIEAREADALRDRLTKLTEQHNFLPDKKWYGNSALRVLDELSKRLPDDTYVIQFDFDGKTVQVQGESGSSASLVEELESSPLFKDVGFKAQVTKVQGTGTDRFHISAAMEATEKGPVPVPNAAEAASLSSLTASAPSAIRQATTKP